MKSKRVAAARSPAQLQAGQIEIQPEAPRWTPVLRVAFRFFFVYFGLFSLATQISGSLFLIPGLSFRGLGPMWPMRNVTFWIAEYGFHNGGPFVYTGVSGGETIFFWVQTFWLFIVAVLATGI